MKIYYKLIKNLLSLYSLLFGKFVRNNAIVAVLSAHNNFTGNCKYAVCEIQKKYPNKRIICFVQNTDQEKELQKIAHVETGLRLSLYYCYIVSRAKYIITDGNMDGVFLVNGAVQINFWHGTALKKIRYDDLKKEPSFIRKFIWWLNRNTFVQSGSSQYDSEFLCRAGRYPLSMARDLGLPCIAPLVDKNALDFEIANNTLMQAFVEKANGFDKVYLYAPTFRDNGTNFLKILKLDLEKLNTVCKAKNILFVFKMHPWCHFDLDFTYSNIYSVDTRYDATLLIGVSDVVVSDYSSIYFSAMAGTCDSILIHGDIDDYKRNNRTIYDERMRDMKGHIVNTFDDICTIIQQDIKIVTVPKKVVEKYWSKTAIKNPRAFIGLIK